ncbi:Gfo/Idh/MocA family oxidoreductase [Curtobacterium sp. NPDC089991]|uniref:Gfo/Idh/MocA family protein n=1 Tax=Curtobacterium sp. NPDC089991 TaxID=3363969 RepID=UPI00380BA4D1
MRVGVAGLGRIGAMHARNLARTPGVDEVVLVGRDAGRTEAVRTRLDEQRGGETGWASMSTTVDPLTDVLPSLDGVLVASATDTHADLARVVADSHTPLLIEKPLALGVDELTELSHDLDATGTPIMVAFHRRYDPGYQRLRQHVLDGDVGALRLVQATENDHHALPVDYIPQSHGMWLDLLVHDFDIIPWVVGDPVVEVSMIGSVLDEPVYGDHQDTDTAMVTLRFASGAVGSIGALRRSGAGQDVRLEVIGTNGAFGAGFGPRTPITSTEPGGVAPANPYDTFGDRFVPAFEEEVAHFVRMIRGESESLTPPAAGVVATALAEAAAESFHTGRPVRPRSTASTTRTTTTA